ncbi:MAG: UDPGP type 1 family protein [Pirellulaceae bacterium]|nr:UDPGP type 1 family protein [Pirellulaceae bacterium]
MEPTDKDRLITLLSGYRQEHLLQFWDDLDLNQQANLREQIAAIDFDLMKELSAGEKIKQDFSQLAARARPPKAYRFDDVSLNAGEIRSAAENAISSGKLGVVLVAGGQGTRLGFPHPKGMFRLGPLSDRTLFQIHIDQLLAVSARYGVRIPLYLMTSPVTHDETVDFLQKHENFGLPPEDLYIFCQGTMPAVDSEGKLLLERPDRISLSPDGHGGMLAAFHSSGCLRDVTERGLEQLFYFQVDNPLARICDLDLVGYHLHARSELTTQVVAKCSADEKVGNVVEVDGQIMVIEYSDLPAAAGERVRSDGSLELWAGNIAIHIFQVQFLIQATQEKSALSFHRALKKVPYLNEGGRVVVPDEPNATKFEKFIFDLMPQAKNAIVVEAAAEEVFAPVKNAVGAAKDSPETARSAMIARDQHRLRAAGIVVGKQVDVEINPRFALGLTEIRQKLDHVKSIDEDTYFE